ncbi:hypothetical protein [Rhizobium laguerreae]|uniref:hypothetical protein n=1 Tax=Rhizobium laguerreae TaxID=1076926 RepID=UPI001C90EAF0|nr:hypothetical protein [Rhizobium laguerreae]MBY3314756.1 hypothetical protein [Rhizobium laguerreae]
MVLVLGTYVSLEDRRRLQQMRAATKPAPRYVPELSRGYAPGGRGGRTDVSPSEGSALMLDKYGHLLPPRDELLNDPRTPAEIREENAQLRQDDPDFSGLGGEAVLSQEEIDVRAQVIIENRVLGNDPVDMTEMSEVDIARVQEGIYDLLMQPADFELEDAAWRMAENRTPEGTVIDQLYKEEPGVAYVVEDHTYHLEFDALVETRPDGDQVVFKDAELVQKRALEIRQELESGQQQEKSSERSQHRQQEPSRPIPSQDQPRQEAANATEVSQSDLQKIRATFSQQFAKSYADKAPAREASAKRAAAKEQRNSAKSEAPTEEPKLAPAQELAKRADEGMKLNAERRQAVSTEATFSVDPQAMERGGERTSAAEAKPEQPAVTAEPSKPLSPIEQAANRGAASMQQNADRRRPPTLVEHLQSKPEGHIAVHPTNGFGYRLEGDTIHAMKDGKPTGWTMKAEDMQKFELDARQQKQAGPSQQAAASEKPQQAAPAQKPQGKIAQAAQAQSGGGSSTQNAAAQAEATMKANAERRAQQQEQQKHRGAEIS